MNLNIEISEEAKQLIGSMANRGGDADRALAHALDLQNELTIGMAQRDKLSAAGPTTLGVRTGRLRQSISRTNAVITGHTIEGGIGTNVAYAAAHEYGFDGEVQVRSFVRRNSRRDLFSVKKKKLSAHGISYVKGFSRHMRLQERSFIRSSIANRIDDYETALSEAVVNALGGSS